MNRANDVMRWLAVLGLLAGVGFLLAPISVDVEPMEVGILADSVPVSTMSRTGTDSLTEDIILYNLFAPSRTAPSRRYSATHSGTQDTDGDVPSSALAGSFMPELIGTAVSQRPGETKALLR